MRSDVQVTEPLSPKEVQEMEIAAGSSIHVDFGSEK